MQKLTCELCGSSSFTKTDDGMFMCDFCGCKYTPEQAKVIINGVVETTMGKSELIRLANNAKLQLNLGNDAKETINKIILEYPSSFYGYWYNLIHLFNELYKFHWLTNEIILDIKENYAKVIKTIDNDSEISLKDVEKYWEDSFVYIYSKLLSGEILWNPGYLNAVSYNIHPLIRKAYDLGLKNAKILNDHKLFARLDQGKALIFKDNSSLKLNGFGRFLFVFGKYIEFTSSDGEINKAYLTFSIENMEVSLTKILEVAESDTQLFIRNNNCRCFCGSVLNQKLFIKKLVCPRCKAEFEAFR